MNVKQTKDRGFTIVELLIVIVVIAILAAITIVAHNGIQNRARTSSNQSGANTLIKKAEAYNAGRTNAAGYPTAVGDFATVNESTLAGSGLTLGPVTSGTASTYGNIEYLPCTTVAGAGATVSYWNYSTGAKVSTVIGGTCTTMGTTAFTGTY